MEATAGLGVYVVAVYGFTAFEKLLDLAGLAKAVLPSMFAAGNL